MSLYGLLIGIGLIIIIEYVSRKKLLNISEILIVILTTLFSSRLLFVVHNIPETLNKQINPIAVWDGGLTIYGAIVGILISLFFITKRNNSSYFKLTDSFFFLIPLAQSIGRWGNFFNHELYGRPTQSIFGIFIPLENRLPGYEEYQYFHPTFIYESILNLLNFLLLLILKKRKIKDGYITAIYLINYSVIRIFLNTVRIDKEYFLNIETSNIFSVLFLTIGMSLIIYLSKTMVKDYIAKIISRPITIVLVLSAVISIILEAKISTRYELMLAILTFIVPMTTIVLFRIFKITSDFNVTKREERPKLFFTMAITFLSALYIAYISKDPVILTAYLVLNLTFFSGFIITLFWKISYHMIWSSIATFVLIYIWQKPELYLLILILPFIAWSRLQLKRHTLMQVIAGTLLTGICILVVLTLF